MYPRHASPPANTFRGHSLGHMLLPQPRSRSVSRMHARMRCGGARGDEGGRGERRRRFDDDRTTRGSRGVGRDDDGRVGWLRRRHDERTSRVAGSGSTCVTAGLPIARGEKRKRGGGARPARGGPARARVVVALTSDYVASLIFIFGRPLRDHPPPHPPPRSPLDHRSSAYSSTIFR
jgi:hypothetical protein